MELMDLSVDRLYQLAYTNGLDITEHFLKLLAYSVSHIYFYMPLTSHLPTALLSLAFEFCRYLQ